MIQIDMKMPSRCYYCPFAKDKKTNDYGSFCECMALGNHETINLLEHSRHSNCPLIEQEPCDDCISRQAVLDDIARIGLWKSEPKEVQAVAECLRAIEALPPVTSQPKTGRWADDKCSACGKGIEDLIESPEWYWNESLRYCPFCGIRIQLNKAESEE